MDPDDVVRLRLRHQRLREPFASTAEGALKNLLAVQSQEFAYARWTLAQRSAGGTAAAVERAVSDGTILRTHILRPTWHFVHRDDLRWLLALSGPRIHQGNAGMYRRTGLDAAEGAKTSRVLAGAVAGGAHKTREQLAEALRSAGLAVEGPGLAYRIMHAEASGVLVSGGPVRSAGGALKQSYTLFDERVPDAPAELMDRPAPDRSDPVLRRIRDGVLGVAALFGRRGAFCAGSRRTGPFGPAGRPAGRGVAAPLRPRRL